jgi:hypothetical protein
LTNQAAATTLHDSCPRCICAAAADVKAVEVLRTVLGLGEMQAYANMMLYYGFFMVRALRNDPALAKVTPFGHDDPCEKMFYLVRQFPRYGQWRPCQ